MTVVTGNVEEFIKNLKEQKGSKIRIVGGAEIHDLLGKNSTVQKRKPGIEAFLGRDLTIRTNGLTALYSEILKLLEIDYFS